MTDIVRLKPLEWMERRQDYWDATTIFGIYQVHRSSASTTTKYQIHRPGKLGWIEFPTIDDAKAACEADYRERIAPAFTSPWQPMESAPKDGRDVLLLIKGLDGVADVGNYRQGEWEDHHGFDFDAAAWMEIPPLEQPK